MPYRRIHSGSRSTLRTALLPACMAFAAGLSGCKSPLSPEPANTTLRAAAVAPSTSYPCTASQSLSFGAAIPPDFSQVTADQDADCFGWQQFIALNYPQSGSAFGAPGDTSPVQWQGWMSIEQIFRPDGAAPPPWGTQPKITAECLGEAGLSAKAAQGKLALNMTSKFSTEFDRKDSAQAFPGNAPAWLGDVNGRNVWYEIRVNQDEYNYIVANKLYTAAGQAEWYANNPTGVLTQPMGAWRPTQTTGSMEVKTAWMEVPDPSDPQWNDYKLSDAVVVDPSTQTCEQVTVAMVGMHIIHKTQGQPSWIWSTFEHARNAPDANALATAAATSWNFYDPSCQAQAVDVPAACQFNGQASVTTTCTPNTPPQYYLGDGCPAPTPTQVTRLTPIDAAATAANAAATSAIQSAYPAGSVWNNYVLVNVLWSTNPPIAQPRSVPQTFNSPQPNAPVANTTLETYIQQSTCVDCHRYATIAGSQSLPADFSFVYATAKVAATDSRLLKSVHAPRTTRRIIE